MKKVGVWDLAVRLSHLLFGVLVLGAFLTSEEDHLVPVHTRIGLVLLGVVLFRVVWGFVGSKHARFADFVRSPRVGAGRAAGDDSREGGTLHGPRWSRQRGRRWRLVRRLVVGRASRCDFLASPSPCDSGERGRGRGLS